MSEPATLVGVLERNAAERGDVVAVVTEERTITHGELDAASRELAGAFVGAGRVGLLGPNDVDWVVTAMAIVRAGATVVPLSTLLRPPELRAQLDVAGVGRVVAPGERPAGDAALPEVRPGDDLVVLFTSGSTGAPKGTIHTHASALAACTAALDARRLGPGQRLYMPMPFFWTGGFATALVSTLVAGATLLTEAKPDPARTLRFLERERVTLFRGWPDQAAALAAHPDFASTDLSSLTDASLPALLPPERRPAPGGRPNIFGMTETFGPWCGDRLDLDLPAAKHGSCGRPFAGVEVRVVDGELQLRGPSLLRGVCGRDDSEVFAADGWLPTGDRGRVDDDGYVWFDGRVDDMFKVKGATVYPSEVEAALRSIDGVAQAHVTDVDGAVGALVVTGLDVDDVRGALRERLSSFKVPTRWHLAGDAGAVPMLASGKVDKQALRAVLEGTPA